jgi:hypothetical protein
MDDTTKTEKERAAAKKEYKKAVEAANKEVSEGKKIL